MMLLWQKHANPRGWLMYTGRVTASWAAERPPEFRPMSQLVDSPAGAVLLNDGDGCEAAGQIPLQRNEARWQAGIEGPLGGLVVADDLERGVPP